jgi:hypothetical protein
MLHRPLISTINSLTILFYDDVYTMMIPTAETDPGTNVAAPTNPVDLSTREKALTVTVTHTHIYSSVPEIVCL